MNLNLISSRRWRLRMNIIGWDSWLKDTDECFMKARRTGAMALRGFWALENSEQRSFRASFIEGNATHASRSVFDTACTMRYYLRFQFFFFLTNSTRELRNISSNCEDRHQIVELNLNLEAWIRGILHCMAFFFFLFLPLHCYVDKKLRGNRAWLRQWDWFPSN